MLIGDTGRDNRIQQQVHPASALGIPNGTINTVALVTNVTLRHLGATKAKMYTHALTNLLCTTLLSRRSFMVAKESPFALTNLAQARATVLRVLLIPQVAT